MADNEKKIIFKVEDDMLKDVSGGKSQKSDGICIYCEQSYTGTWGQHIAKCPNYPG